ncbi:hypothetical protein NQZ68_013562 [Dissostichus eleginoides]|nr:hypothetical protein NQZ68_013562 [Dissostichus eleginoides]
MLWPSCPIISSSRPSRTGEMKLLAVLLVAVVLPNLSEGREVSRCEMNKSLEGKIKLPTRLEKHREKILSICKVNE